MTKWIAIALCVAACGKGDGKAADKGGLAASFDEYKAKSMATEAKLNLNKISKLAKVKAAEASKFPAGTAAATPAGKCCDGPDHKCAVDAAAFAKDPVWQALEFSVDEPSRYQYSYTGTDTAFTAMAVGDLDCDGKMATYVMTGTLGPDGMPGKAELTEPPAGTW
ncbi:MAG: hypothetical protein QM831_02910 [Kofleriaceae bacterium]